MDDNIRLDTKKALIYGAFKMPADIAGLYNGAQGRT